MPGICAILGRPPNDQLRHRLATMLQRMKHHPWYTVESWAEESSGVALGRVSLGYLQKQEQPHSSRDGSLVVIMHGEVYDYPNQRRQLETSGTEFAGDSHAELVMHGYRTAGRAFFREMCGSFVAAVWDSNAQRLTLVNDRFGSKLVYYALLPGRFIIASEIKSILVDEDVPRTENLRGLAQFFTFRQMLGEDTMLESVRVLPPAGWATYDLNEDRLQVDRYWRLGEICAVASNSETTSLDRIDAAFVQAVRRCSTGSDHLGLSLSGGLDSRTILALIDHDRVPIKTVSIGIEGSLDHRSASRLAALTNRDHHFAYLDNRVLAEFEQNLHRTMELTDGHYLDRGIGLPTMPLYRELGIEVLLRGHLGELMHMSKGYNFSLDADAWNIADERALCNWLMSHLSAHMLNNVSGSLFAASRQEDIETLARESLNDALAEADGMEPLMHRIWYLFISQRMPREIAASLASFGTIAEVRTPYLDADLIEALMAAPPQIKVGDSIQTYILRRHRPEFLKVVNANTGAAMGAGKLWERAAKLRMKAFAKLGVRGYQPYARLGLWLRRELEPMVRKILLDDRCLGRGVLRADAVRQVVENHSQNRQNHTSLLMAMIIFELGCRHLREKVDQDASAAAGSAE